MRPNYLLLLLFVFSCTFDVKAQSSPFGEEDIESLSTQLDQAAEAFLKERNVLGAALVVVQDGKTIIKRGYGFTDASQTRAVNPDETIFRIGSISKALSFLAMTRLVDEGKISYDDDVSTLFDGVNNELGFTNPVSVQDLMTHTAGFDQIGIGRQIWQTDLSLDERKALRPSINSFLRDNNLRRVTPSGLHYRYDTYGSTLAGAILGGVTGKSYAEAMQELMFDPLGMNRSSVEVKAELMDDFTSGHGFVNDSYQAQPYEIYLTTPASSIDATAANMGRLLEALTGDGSNSSGRFVTPEMAEAIQAPQFRPHPEFFGVTHGLHESHLGSSRPGAVRMIDHGGSMLGFNSLMAIIPEYNIGVYIVANRNREAGGGDGRVSRPVMDTILAALNVEEPAPIILPEIDPEMDLSEYEGNYYYGVFCHSCSEEEHGRGGWRRGDPNVAKAIDGKLEVRGILYIPRGKDVFVQADGERMIFFGRDDENKIAFYTYSTSADTFERMD